MSKRTMTEIQAEIKEVQAEKERLTQDVAPFDIFTIHDGDNDEKRSESLDQITSTYRRKLDRLWSEHKAAQSEGRL